MFSIELFIFCFMFFALAVIVLTLGVLYILIYHKSTNKVILRLRENGFADEASELEKIVGIMGLSPARGTPREHRKKWENAWKKISMLKTDDPYLKRTQLRLKFAKSFVIAGFVYIAIVAVAFLSLVIIFMAAIGKGLFASYDIEKYSAHKVFVVLIKVLWNMVKAKMHFVTQIFSAEFPSTLKIVLPYFAVYFLIDFFICILLKRFLSFSSKMKSLPFLGGLAIISFCAFLVQIIFWSKIDVALILAGISIIASVRWAYFSIVALSMKINFFGKHKEISCLLGLVLTLLYFFILLKIAGQGELFGR